MAPLNRIAPRTRFSPVDRIAPRKPTPAHGHFWTIVPHVVDEIMPPRASGTPWKTELEDDRFGTITLRGRLDELDGATSMVIIIHGMSGHADKSYVVRAARAARRQKMSSLCLTLRGSDRGGDDIYHAGLVDDLQAAIASPELAKYQNIHVLGFSLGGHMVMRYALAPDARVRSVAAICSPVDLDAACRHIDLPAQRLYRHHLLRGLRENASAVERRRGIRLCDTPLRAIRSIREWDDTIVAPRFGYRGVADYYREVSVSPHIADLQVPALWVFAERDPMLSARDMRSFLARANKDTAIRWLPGGHVRFPARTRAVDEAMRWLRR